MIKNVPNTIYKKVRVLQKQDGGRTGNAQLRFLFVRTESRAELSREKRDSSQRHEAVPTERNVSSYTHLFLTHALRDVTTLTVL